MDSAACGLPTATATSMRENGFVKIACPFGVLIAGTENYRDEYILYGANVLANILDQDADGEVDDPAVVAQLTYRNGNRGAMLACGTSRAEEEKEANLEGFDYTFSCQTWHVKDVSGDAAAADFSGIMQEEAFHMCHQSGFAKVYPEYLGLDDFTSSVACREAARLQCVSPGWWHPENECPVDSPRDPGNPARSPLEPGDGDCTDASCDCAEFYKQALFLAVGASQFDDTNNDDANMWLSDYMPTTQKEALEMLSTEFKEMITNPSLHQLSAPISGEYDRPSPIDDDESLSDKSVKSQCYSNAVEFEGDRLDNPVWSVGDQTLSQCKAMCSTQRDELDRPCVAIEYKDGGQNLPATEKRNCNMAWACDYTESWSGGSVYSGDAHAPAFTSTVGTSSFPDDRFPGVVDSVSFSRDDAVILNGVACLEALVYSYDYCVKGRRGDPEGMVCANDGQYDEAYCSYDRVTMCARCVEPMTVVNFRPCESAVVVNDNCQPGAPHFDREGAVCANDAMATEAYCSYSVGDNACAFCSSFASAKSPNKTRIVDEDGNEMSRDGMLVFVVTADTARMLLLFSVCAMMMCLVAAVCFTVYLQRQQKSMVYDGREV